MNVLTSSVSYSVGNLKLRLSASKNVSTIKVIKVWKEEARRVSTPRKETSRLLCVVGEFRCWFECVAKKSNEISHSNPMCWIAVDVILFCTHRPRNNGEVKAGSPSVLQCDQKRGEVFVKQEMSTKTFTYDRVFGPQAKQIEVYKAIVEPLLDEVIMGYNCTVFALVPSTDHRI